MSEEVGEDAILAEIANIAQDVMKSSVNAEILTPVENERDETSQVTDKQNGDQAPTQFDDPGVWTIFFLCKFQYRFQIFRRRWATNTSLRMIRMTMTMCKLQSETFDPILQREISDLIISTRFRHEFLYNCFRFRPQAANAAGPKTTGVSGAIGKQTQKLDLDAVAEINGTPLFDAQLVKNNRTYLKDIIGEQWTSKIMIFQAMVTGIEDAPWRKPGADITDYFNYGFTEHTWVMYCERQQKLRAEYGNNQGLVNKILFSSLTGSVAAGVATAEPRNIMKSIDCISSMSQFLWI